MVSTSYFGASAETLQKSVIAPLEEAINGVENMTYMTSTASNAGVVDITVYFKQGTDPDMAAVNVQNRVSKGDRTASCRSDSGGCHYLQSGRPVSYRCSHYIALMIQL